MLIFFKLIQIFKFNQITNFLHTLYYYNYYYLFYYLRFDMSINLMVLEDYAYFEDIFEFLRVVMKEKLFIFLFNFLFEIQLFSIFFHYCQF